MIGFLGTIFSSASLDKDKKGIIKVRRLPPTRILHAHQLGLALALISTLLAIPSFISTYSLFPPIYVWLFFIILFALGTLLGGFFVLIISLSLIIPLFTQGFDSTIWKAFNYTASWYIAGYVFGAFLALLYNYIVYYHTLYIGKMRVKVAFIFDRDQRFNFIKTPCENEQHEEYKKLNKKVKLYNYDLISEPREPYTIVFIANPFIMKKTKIGDEYKIEFEKDPIIDNLELFLRSVDTALYSFEQDEVLGRPEIWSRVRILAIFDEDWANVPDGEKENLALVQPLSYYALIDDEIAENIIEPSEAMWEYYKYIINHKVLSQENLTNETKSIIKRTLSETDVIFALSASTDFTRSTARFSDWLNNLEILVDVRKGGKDFTFEICSEQSQPNEDGSDSLNKVITAQHDEYPIVPGRVALNVLGANNRTYIHEFGHAMSSALNGVIVDEYFDKYQILGQTENPSTQDNIEGYIWSLKPEELEKLLQIGKIKAPFSVNRQERKKYDNGKVEPIPRLFVKYNGREYYSDLNHPSSEENWQGYFPERQSPSEFCTMDRYYGRFRYDKLISDFMYDRLITKINRPLHTEVTK